MNFDDELQKLNTASDSLRDSREKVKQSRPRLTGARSAHKSNRDDDRNAEWAFQSLALERDLHVAECQTHASKIYSLTPLMLSGLLAGVAVWMNSGRNPTVPAEGVSGRIPADCMLAAVSVLSLIVFLYYILHASLLRSHTDRLQAVERRLNALMKFPAFAGSGIPVLVPEARNKWQVPPRYLDTPFYGIMYVLGAFPLIVAIGAIGLATVKPITLGAAAGLILFVEIACAAWVLAAFSAQHEIKTGELLDAIIAKNHSNLSRDSAPRVDESAVTVQPVPVIAVSGRRKRDRSK